MPVGMIQPTELLQDDVAWADEPRRLAEDVFGHHVEDDAVRGERLTCTQCGKAVLREGVNIYGSAVEWGCVHTDVGRAWNAAHQHLLPDYLQEGA